MKKIQNVKDGREVITLKHLKVIYNGWLDDTNSMVNIAGYNFLPSDILQKMSPKRYDRSLKEFYDSSDKYYCKTYEG